jgi:hypothetical protein
MVPRPTEAVNLILDTEGSMSMDSCRTEHGGIGSPVMVPTQMGPLVTSRAQCGASTWYADGLSIGGVGGDSLDTSEDAGIVTVLLGWSNQPQEVMPARAEGRGCRRPLVRQLNGGLISRLERSPEISLWTAEGVECPEKRRCGQQVRL